MIIAASLALLAAASAALVGWLRAPPPMWDLSVPLGRASDAGHGSATIPMTCIVGYRGDPADENARGALIDFRRATGAPTDRFGPDLWHSLTIGDFAPLLATRNDGSASDGRIRDAVRGMWVDHGCRVDNRTGGHDDP